MSDNRLFEAVSESLAETFENMVFMEILPAEEGTVLPEDFQPIWAGLAISAPIQAFFSIVVSADLAREIAMGIFGLFDEESLTQEMIWDSLAELVNTVSGRIMATLTPSDQTFQLGLPDYGEGWPPDKEQATSYQFTNEESIILVMVQGDFSPLVV